MKKIILSALVAVMLGAAFVATGQQPSEQRRKVQVFGVAFYNLENLFDTVNNNGKYDLEFSPAGSRKWNSQKYWSKIKNLAYVISQMKSKYTPMGPAIIGVSEVENITVLEDLVKARIIAADSLKIVHHDSPDRRGIDVSLLYNPRFFKLINVTNHTLFVDSLPYFRTRDQMCVVGLLGGKRTGIIVNHWPSRIGGAEQSSYLREAAASLTRHIADSLLRIDPDMGIIVMGDLNDDPMNKSVSMSLGAVKKAKDCKPGGFFNPFWKKLDDGIGSYIYRGSWNLFDQIIVNYNLVNGASGLKYYGAEVLNKDFLKQKSGQYQGYPHRTFSSGVWTDGYSDHFPTEIFLIREK